MLSNTLFAGLSGMNVAQAKLNVVGNNIANANTVAFKSTRALITPQFYVTDSAGSQPAGDNGGSNPIQRGLGAVVADLERNFQAGAIESTGKATDLAIDGDGFFIVQSDERKYTRDGTFKLNANNFLVTSSGDFVQGYGVDGNFNITTGQLGNLNVPLNVATIAQATTQVRMQGNLNASGDVASGASILTSQELTLLGGAAAPDAATTLVSLAAADDPAVPLFAVGETYTLAGQKGGRALPEQTFTVAAASTLQDLMNFYQRSLGINLDVPDDGNPDTPEAGLVVAPVGAATARIEITGNLGAVNALALNHGSFTSTGGNAPLSFAAGANAAGIQSNPAGESIQTSFIVYDSLGTPVVLNVAAVLESFTEQGSVWRFFAESPDAANGNSILGTGTLSFDTAGRLRQATGTALSVDRAGTGAVSPLTFNLDLAGMTGLTSRTSELVMSNQNGLPVGRLTAFSIGSDGQITGSFSNGATRTLGQIALATFSNRHGLLDRGGNMFVEGANSGAAVIGTPGTLSVGRIVAGSLELSNVDISEEFINLIIASTGFSAASRVISTSDQLLTALLNSR
jgi:flagellar hook protein FlgE